MVTPERGWDARFDGSASTFLSNMKDLIRARFADILGDDVDLLDETDGLDRLSNKYRARLLNCSATTLATAPALAPDTSVLEGPSRHAEAEMIEEEQLVLA